MPAHYNLSVRVDDLNDNRRPCSFAKITLPSLAQHVTIEATELVHAVPLLPVLEDGSRVKLFLCEIVQFLFKMLPLSTGKFKGAVERTGNVVCDGARHGGESPDDSLMVAARQARTATENGRKPKACEAWPL